MRPLLLALFLPTTALAYSLELSNSGYLLDSEDRALEGAVSLKFSIWTDPVAGTRTWASAPGVNDPACSVPVRSGYYAVRLGSACGTGLTTTQLPPGEPRYLEIEVDGATLTPRHAITAVPVATMALALPPGAVDASMLADSPVVPGSYTNASFTVDEDGRLTAASSGPSPIVGFTGGAGLVASVTDGVASVAMAPVLGPGFTWNGAPIANAYVASAATWDAKVASVTAGAGLTLSGTPTNPTISVTPGALGTSYSSGSTTIAAGASLDVAHNLGSNDLTVQVWRTTDAGSTWELVQPVSSASTVDPVYGSGVDGALTATSADHRIDTVRGTVNGTAGAGSVTVSMVAGTFAPGDAVLLLQMQGPNAGKFEEAIVTSVAGNSVAFASPIVNAYSHGTGASVAQILRVPQYTTVNVPDGMALRPSPWDGTTGGVLAFKATGQLSLNSTGKLDASGRGFRGGATGGSTDTSPTTRPFTGESHNGPAVVGTSANGGGGSGGVASNSEGMTGGFGASHGGSGAAGVQAYVSGGAQGQVGATYGLANLTSIFLGSGGGGGSNSYWTGLNPQLVQANGFGSGGAGGGIVYVEAKTIQAGGQVLADGAAGQAGYLRASTGSDISGGGGGGGSGGSIYVASTNANGTFLARGGAGGTASATSYGSWTIAPVGGAGGVGRIRIDGSGAITSNPTHQVGSPVTAVATTGLSVRQTSANVVRVTNSIAAAVTVRVVVKK